MCYIQMYFFTNVYKVNFNKIHMPTFVVDIYSTIKKKKKESEIYKRLYLSKHQLNYIVYEH